MIGDILYDLNLFVDGRGYAGRVKELKPPVLEPEMIEYKAGGLAAAVDIPMGRIKKMEAEATLGAYDDAVLKAFRVLPGEQFAFTFRGARVSDDGARSPVLIALRGIISKIDPGTWKPGEEMPLALSMSVRYYRQEIAGRIVHEIDPVGYRVVVDGVDLLASTRQYLGI